MNPSVWRWPVAIFVATILLTSTVWLMSTLIIPDNIRTNAASSLVIIDFIRAVNKDESPQQSFTPTEPPETALPEKSDIQAPPAPLEPAQILSPPAPLPIQPLFLQSNNLVKPRVDMNFLDNVAKPIPRPPPRKPKAKSPSVKSHITKSTTTKTKTLNPSPLKSGPAVKPPTALIIPLIKKIPPVKFQEALYPLYTPSPRYPRLAKRRRIEGWVNVSFVINIQGKVENLEILAAQPETVFDRATLKTLSRWKFKPQLLGGKPMPRQVVQTIYFKLGR